jgi:hypothetical protein
MFNRKWSLKASYLPKKSSTNIRKYCYTILTLTILIFFYKLLISWHFFYLIIFLLLIAACRIFLYFCQEGIPPIHIDDVKECYATYIIIHFVSYLPDDGFMLSRNMWQIIQYTKQLWLTVIVHPCNFLRQILPGAVTAKNVWHYLPYRYTDFNDP